MGRVDEIKHNCEISADHIRRMDEQKLGFHIMSYQRDYVSDVTYLLSRIQIAEEALKRIKKSPFNLSDCAVIAEEAIEQIQNE